jgi:predicted transposase/invertase (TIGR01784 family)
MEDKTAHDAFHNWEMQRGNEDKYWPRQVLDKDAAIREAELRIEAARREGIREGKREAIAKIKQAVRDIAKRMLDEGYDIEMVIDTTGLTREQVDKINQDKN